MAFDLSAARKAGYSDAEIIDFLAGQQNFDAAGAREAGHSESAILGLLMRPPPPPERSTGERVARAAAMPFAGVNESIATTIGAPFDLVNRGLRAVGVPIPEGSVTDAARRGLRYITGEPPAPETTTERALYGAGKGAADAAGIMLPAAGVARAAQAGSVLQGAAQALTAQPVMQALSGAAGGAVSEATDSPLAGAAAALAVPLGRAALSRALTPVRPTLSPEAEALAQGAAREGIPLTAAQRTGSKPLQTAEAVFERMPLTAGPQGAIREGQQVAFNRAALSRAGIAADRATPDVLAAAQQRLGSEFERLSAATTVQLDPAFMRDVGQVVSRYGSKLPSQQRPAFAAYVRDIMSSGGSLPGQTYQMTRSDLTRQARSAMQSDPFFGRALEGLRDALDDAAGRSIPTDMREAWNTARRQYANLQVIAKAASGAGQGGAVGDISAAGLRGALAQGDRRGYAMGRGDLNELARIGQQFIRQQVPNSGTPERTMMQNLLTGGGVGGTSVMLGADPLTGVALGAGSLLAPRAVQGAYNLPAVQQYLAQGTGATVAGPQRNALAAILAARLKNEIAPGQP